MRLYIIRGFGIARSVTGQDIDRMVTGDLPDSKMHLLLRGKKIDGLWP